MDLAYGRYDECQGCRLSEIGCGLGAVPASEASASDEVERYVLGPACTYQVGMCAFCQRSGGRLDWDQMKTKPGSIQIQA